MALARVYGVDMEALVAAALAAPQGQQKAKFCSDFAVAFGSAPRVDIEVGGVSKYRANFTAAMTGAAAGVLPAPLGAPTVNVADPVAEATPSALLVIRHPTLGRRMEVPIAATPVAGKLLISPPLNGTDIIALAFSAMQPPSGFDVAAPPPAPTPTPPPAPTPSPPSGTPQYQDFLYTALRDMRRDPATGNYSYLDSYAQNDAVWYLRNESYSSSQATRAQLSMGRFGTSAAFTSANPDVGEVSWVGNDIKAIPVWPQLVGWDQTGLAGSDGRHAAGWQNNTRCLYWRKELWIKRSNGVWSRIATGGQLNGATYWPNFSYAGGDFWNGNSTGQVDMRHELNGTSVRPVPAGGPDRYRVPHTYFGYVGGLDSANIVSVCSVGRASLVLHDPNGPDDRDASRFLYALGADWYPPGGYVVYPGVGTSRMKFVRAKWPDWQYHVMHTDTWANFLASHPTGVGL
ncbi:MAG: hypothetical protein AB7G13_28750 [Lautropia sp.]